MLSKAIIEADPVLCKAVERGIIEIKQNAVVYNLNQKKSYNWSDPEEWVRAHTIAFLTMEKDYPANRMRTEIRVPRRTPNDLADIVVYRDDQCREPYLVVECKSDSQTNADRAQGVEQLFGNANSLRAPLGLYDEYSVSTMYDVGGYPATERQDNIKGERDVVPAQYGDIPAYTYFAGPGNKDIEPARPKVLESKIRRAHSIIWAGGKRDPLMAFEAWSKLLFAKVEDERSTPNTHPRRFQVGINETTAAIATRVHSLFEEACRNDRSIFPEGIQIALADRKIAEIVKVLQDISITDTSTDSIGAAFESFFGSVFRGELGQYFTMRQIARFTVGMLDIGQNDYVIDPTAGSGGFLLEVLLQVWHKLDSQFAGRKELDRYKNDFALHKVFGIEIHDVLGRICKINLLLHHDGHTNIESDRSCLDSTFGLPRLNPFQGRFTRVVGNPPFGDDVGEGDDDLLGSNTLSNFVVAAERTGVPSEHAIIERAVDLLEPNGRLGLVLPDGLFNNQGELSNCPRTRRFLAKNGIIEAIVSLPDYAFRKSGAQNKTSILFFRKFTVQEKAYFEQSYNSVVEDEEEKILAGLRTLNYKVFLAEANHVGYVPSGTPSEMNDLYRGSEGGRVDANQTGTILGEFRRFQANTASYDSHKSPDCMAISIVTMWTAHDSHRLDPKYFLFKQEERTHTPPGWLRLRLSQVMERRETEVRPENRPEQPVVVLTIAQTGDIRPRQAGKGNNPPQWLGMYFEDSPSTWYAARSGDVVFSSIDLWKGCISVVPEEFDGALVTKEFPIYRITDDRLNPDFLSCILRSRYYQRAFRAITTGHSNRRRTQVADFEALEICFPCDADEQKNLIKDILLARQNQRTALDTLKQSMIHLSDAIDGRGAEIYDLDDEIGDED